MSGQCLVLRDHSGDCRLALPSPARQPLAGAPSGRLVVAHGQRGFTGQVGPPGPAGGAAVQRVAGETLSALRMVYELNGQVFLLSAGDAAHIDLLLGLVLTAAPAGAATKIQLFGAVDDAAWAWTPGPVWLGTNGVLTQAPPTSGFDVRLGTAVSATRVILNIEEPIWLEE